MVKHTKKSKKVVKRKYKPIEESRKKDPKTIVGMAYQELRKYKKRTGLG